LFHKFALRPAAKAVGFHGDVLLARQDCFCIFDLHFGVLSLARRFVAAMFCNTS